MYTQCLHCKQLYNHFLCYILSLIHSPIYRFSLILISSLCFVPLSFSLPIYISLSPSLLSLSTVQSKVLPCLEALKEETDEKGNKGDVDVRYYAEESYTSVALFVKSS